MTTIVVVLAVWVGVSVLVAAWWTLRAPRGAVRDIVTHKPIDP